MIPFKVDTGCDERVTSLVVDGHRHDVVFEFERTVGYTGQAVTTDRSGGNACCGGRQWCS